MNQNTNSQCCEECKCRMKIMGDRICHDDTCPCHLWFEAGDKLLALAKDHYWDTLESEKDIILQHLKALLTLSQTTTSNEVEQ